MACLPTEILSTQRTLSSTHQLGRLEVLAQQHQRIRAVRLQHSTEVTGARRGGVGGCERESLHSSQPCRHRHACFIAANRRAPCPAPRPGGAAACAPPQACEPPGAPARGSMGQACHWCQGPHRCSDMLAARAPSNPALNLPEGSCCHRTCRLRTAASSVAVAPAGTGPPRVQPTEASTFRRSFSTCQRGV